MAVTQAGPGGFAPRGRESRGSGSVMVAFLTLLRAEMTHFVFADSLPQRAAGQGALRNQWRLVSGPSVRTFSHLDAHPGVMYPLSSQVVGDSAELSTMSRKWGALGFEASRASTGLLFPRSRNRSRPQPR